MRIFGLGLCGCIEVNTHSHNSHFYFGLISIARLWQRFGIPLYQAWTDQYVAYTFVLALKFKTAFLCFNLSLHIISSLHHPSKIHWSKLKERRCKVKENKKEEGGRRAGCLSFYTRTIPTRAYESEYFFFSCELSLENLRSMRGCGRVRRKETKQERKAWGHYYICPVLRAVMEKVGIFCESYRVETRREIKSEIVHIWAFFCLFVWTQCLILSKCFLKQQDATVIAASFIPQDCNRSSADKGDENSLETKTIKAVFMPLSMVLTMFCNDT